MNVYKVAERAPTREDLLDQARDVGECAWSQREQAERDRRMSDDVVEKLRSTGLMKLCRHRKWGGAESDPMTFLDVGREISRGSAALGWIYCVLGFHDWYMAFASDQFQEDVWGKDPDAFICDSFAPVGKIERAADGYLVTGRWRFASGIEWSSWVGVGGIAIAPDGETPEHILFFLPKDDVVVDDDWNTLGLRGTASRAVSVDRMFVPEHRAFPLGRVARERGPVVNDGLLWRMPLMTMQGLAIIPSSLGVAQRVVEEFHSWTKARVRPATGLSAKEAPAAQLALAEGATQWDASWALAQKYAQSGWDRAQRGETYLLTDEERAQLFAWRGYIGRSSIRLCDELFTGSGAMALFDTHPLQQLFRDVHATGGHIGVDQADAYTSRGRVAMGFPGNPNQ